MSCQQVRFALADCVVEISPEFGDDDSRKAKAYTARLSLVENGSVVRPLVSGSGRRVKIRAASEQLAYHSALSYLRVRFGSISREGQPCRLGEATVGLPVAVED